MARDIAEILDSPITLEEVTEAFTVMQSGKSPGPDGYPVEFFKRFSEKLTPRLLRMYTEILESGDLSKILHEAQISLLLKKKKSALLKLL